MKDRLDLGWPDELVQLREEVEAVATAAVVGRPVLEDSWMTGFCRDFALELGRRGWLGMTWPLRKAATAAARWSASWLGAVTDCDGAGIGDERGVGRRPDGQRGPVRVSTPPAACMSARSPTTPWGTGAPSPTSGEEPAVLIPHRKGIGGLVAHADGGFVISARNVAHKRPLEGLLDPDALQDEAPFEIDDQAAHPFKHAELGIDDIYDVWRSDPLFYPAVPPAHLADGGRGRRPDPRRPHRPTRFGRAHSVPTNRLLGRRQIPGRPVPGGPMTKKMTRQEEHEFYADPDNQTPPRPSTAPPRPAHRNGPRQIPTRCPRRSPPPRRQRRPLPLQLDPPRRRNELERDAS